MRRKSFKTMPCPVARGLERVGEWWSILILRDAHAGMTRFDEFQTSLGIAPNTLTRRLGALVAAGLLRRRRYQERPVRHDYVLTDRGQDFRPVLLALQTWGTRHFAPEGASVLLVDSATGLPAEPVLVDRVTGQPITAATHRNVAGPAAGPGMRQRLATARPAATDTLPSSVKPRRRTPAGAPRSRR
jgi:DNA-binding HxlR family transcriptional regulator